LKGDFCFFFAQQMFTRHFYEVDEVVAALRWCMRQGRIQEALFWCLELLDSELLDKVRDELYTNWLWLFGLGSLSALPLLQDYTCLELVYGLTRLPKEKRDRSILVLLLFGSMDTVAPDRPSYIPCLEPLFEQKECTGLERAFLSAVYQGKSRVAFDLSRPLWQQDATRVFELLQEIQRFKHNQESLAESLTLLEFQSIDPWATRACAIGSVCLDKKRLQNSLKPLDTELPPHLVATLEEWKEITGRRKRRIFAIPHECLYKVTERGCRSNKESTLEKLYTLNEERLEGCPFWNRVLEEEVPWINDERKEAFYDLYFPDDIPDEWSKQDQEKSHGPCVLINNEVVNEKKYIDRWYRGLETRAYWLTSLSVPNDWMDRLNQPWMEFVSTWCLTPVKKRILVVEGEPTSA